MHSPLPLHYFLLNPSAMPLPFLSCGVLFPLLPGLPKHNMRTASQGPLVQSVLDLIGSGSGVITTVANAIGISPENSATILGMADLVPEIVDTGAAGW